jgi:ketosteroid isomerase-like protein
MPPAEEITRELEAFYKGYIEAFNREDIDMFSETFAYPYAWVDGKHGLRACANESDHQRGFGIIMIALKERGWVRSAIDRLHAWPLAENLAMILADVTRYKSGDAILERVRACYTVRRDARGWKIVTLSEVQPPFLGPGNTPR